MYIKHRQKGMGKLGVGFPKRLKVGRMPGQQQKATGRPLHERATENSDRVKQCHMSQFG